MCEIKWVCHTYQRVTGNEPDSGRQQPGKVGNFQMSKLSLEKEDELEVKLATFYGI